MTQIFDIRFARSAGLAALLEAPVSNFRWKGRGLLSVSPDGITIAARLGLASLFRRAPPHRIPVASLKEVYREGAELRLEFATSGNPREVVALWTRDRDTAADIVRNLPTRRTVEIEEAPAREPSPRFRWDRRVAGALAVLLLVGLAAPWLLTRAPAPEPVLTGDAAPPAPAVADLPVTDVTMPTLRDIREGIVIPIPPGTAAFDAARHELGTFEREAEFLLLDYRKQRTLFETDALSPTAFADYLLNSLEMQWWNVTFRLLDSDALADPALVGLREAMLGASRHWRHSAELQAAALRKRDTDMMVQAYAVLGRAEELQERARRYVRE